MYLEDSSAISETLEILNGSQIKRFGRIFSRTYFKKIFNLCKLLLKYFVQLGDIDELEIYSSVIK